MITNTQCQCGQPIQIRDGADATCTIRPDGKQAVYPDDLDRRAYTIFRCRCCHSVVDETVPEYADGTSEA